VFPKYSLFAYNTKGEVKTINKKILVLLVSVLAIAMLVTPLAVAKPTKGPNKMAVTMTQSPAIPPIDFGSIVAVPTGNAVHISQTNYYDVTIEVRDDAGTLVETLTGTNVVYRNYVAVKQKDGLEKWIFNDYYEFDFGEGGFVGNGKVIMDGVDFDPFTGTLYGYEQSMGCGLFHGTGDFEGQTLNVGHHMGEALGGIVWTGYWLKY
jgi:hypothetical protein